MVCLFTIRLFHTIGDQWYLARARSRRERRKCPGRTLPPGYGYFHASPRQFPNSAPRAWPLRPLLAFDQVTATEQLAENAQPSWLFELHCQLGCEMPGHQLIYCGNAGEMVPLLGPMTRLFW